MSHYKRNGKEYQRVTKWLNQWKQPFEVDRIAPFSAKKEGRTVDEIKEKWSMKADISIDYGNAIHKAVEYYIKFGEVVDTPHIAKAVNKLGDKYDLDKLHTEITVYNDDILVAGTIDLIEPIKKGEIGIIDIKTNAEIDTKSYNKYKPPLDHLPQNKLNDYRLQQSTYKWLAEQTGLKVKFIRLEHWDGSEFSTIELEPIDIKSIINQLN